MLQHRRISEHRLLGWVGLSLAFGVALVAAASNGARAQASDAVDATPIILGETNSGGSQIPLYVALKEGFFKKAGLNVSTEDISGGTPTVMAAFSRGSVNLLSLSAPEVIEYVGSKVITGKAFAELIDQSFDVVGSKAITNVQDLKGKTLAIGISGPNAGDWIYLLAVMQHYGVTANDMTFITAGSPLNRLAALSTGAIQISAEPNNVRAQSSTAGNVILKSGDSPIQFPGNVYVANRDLIDNHKALLKKFVAVLGQTTAWIKANPQAAAPDCAQAINSTPADCLTTIALGFDRSVTSPYTWSSTLGLNIDGIKSALTVMAIVQPDTKNLTLDDIVDTSIAGTSP